MALVVLVVSIVRKVDQSVRLQSDEKKTSHCNSRALFTRKAPTKNAPNFEALSQQSTVPRIMYQDAR